MKSRDSAICSVIAAFVPVVIWPAMSEAQSGSPPASSNGTAGLKGPGLTEEQTRSARYAFLDHNDQRDEAAVRKAIAQAERGKSSKTNANAPAGAEKGIELARSYDQMVRFARAKARELDGPIEAAQRAGQKGRAKNLEKQREQREQKMSSWREKAVKQLAAVARDQPDFSGRDEVLYRLAYLIEEQADDDRRRTERQSQAVPSQQETALRQQARRVYHELIKNYPNSRFIPHAYLSFGEYYFNEGSMDNALQFYNRVAQYESSDVYGYSLYKTAWCHINLQAHREAVSQFVRVIQYAKTNPQARLASELRQLALREIVEPFSQAFPPNRAWAFFERIGGNETIWMMEGLADRYYQHGQWPEATAAYQSLIDENQGSVRVNFYQNRLAECQRHARP